MKVLRRFFHVSMVIAGLSSPFVALPVIAQSAGDRSGEAWDSPSIVEQQLNSFRRDAINRLGPPIHGRTPGETNPSETSRYFNEPTLASITYQVHLVGEVNNPGTYRITASDRLQAVVQRAGGISMQGSLRHIQVRRRGAGTKAYDLLRFQLYGELQQNPYLLDNDVVFVPLRDMAVQIVGSVKRPNTYELHNEHVLADALRLAGGTTIGATTQNPIRIIRFEGGEKKIIEVPNDSMQLQTTPIANGDVIYVSNVLSANRKFDYNVAKLPGDQVFYPSYEDRVFVLGGVHNPGPYPFNPYATVNQYLTVAGGMTKLARVNRIKLITSDGKRRKIRMDDLDVINPGDTIFVPEPRLAPENWLGIVTGLAGFGLSTTATVLSLTR